MAADRRVSIRRVASSSQPATWAHELRDAAPVVLSSLISDHKSRTPCEPPTLRKMNWRNVWPAATVSVVFAIAYLLVAGTHLRVSSILHWSSSDDAGRLPTTPLAPEPDLTSGGYYTGILYGAPVETLPDGRRRWAEYPVIGRVIERSPAARAGIRSGDVILSVNGIDGRQPALLRAQRDGQQFLLVFRRGNSVQTANIKSVATPGDLTPIGRGGTQAVESR